MSVSAWEPFWLGPPSRQLYAALHGVPGTPSTGVVLVPPLLHEMPRSRRFIAEVAGALAAMGLPTLRFDFHGTGDSSGSGEDFDFASMHRDLDLAAAALRERTGITRLVLLAWRGSALALRGWLDRGGVADLIVLWEPIVDGGSWLQELVDGDVGERALRPPPRSGVPRLTDPGDGQLMGFAASQRLRGDLAQARLDVGARRGDAPVWAIVRADLAELPTDVARVLHLPAGAPSFNMGAAMDATFFLTPPVRSLVGELGQAMRAEVPA
ncbi:alpha/beta hydrolase family protein [Lysobacter fragariae]